MENETLSKKQNGNDFIADVTKEEFMKPYRTKATMNDMVAENLKAKGMSEESINDYLQMIDED